MVFMSQDHTRRQAHWVSQWRADHGQSITANGIWTTAMPFAIAARSQRHRRYGIRPCQNVQQTGAIWAMPKWGKPFRRCPPKCARPRGPLKGGGSQGTWRSDSAAGRPRGRQGLGGRRPAAGRSAATPCGTCGVSTQADAGGGRASSPESPDRRRWGRSPRSRSLRRGLPRFARRPPRWARPTAGARQGVKAQWGRQRGRPAPSSPG